MGDGFISTVVVLKGQLHTSVSKKIQSRIGAWGQDCFKLGGFWASNRPGSPRGLRCRAFCTVSVAAIVISSSFPIFPFCSYLLSLTICNDGELHFPLQEAKTGLLEEMISALGA